RTMECFIEVKDAWIEHPSPYCRSPSCCRSLCDGFGLECVCPDAAGENWLAGPHDWRSPSNGYSGKSGHSEEHRLGSTGCCHTKRATALTNCHRAIPGRPV